jgi:primosomal protein N' (replication factor Y)
MRYADVVIDTKSDNVDNFFTYATGGLEGLRAGSKVMVPFARETAKRAGYVFALKDELPPELEGKRIRKIESVDEDLSISEEAVSVCRWMRRRCYCRYIDAVHCFTPAGKASKTGKKRVPEAVSSEATALPEEDRAAPARMDAAPPLTQEQHRAVGTIVPEMERGGTKVFLLRGVTGSGKTEVYMAAAEKARALGRETIMLVPEISLTHQTVERFIGRFGKGRVAILHSGLSAGERFDEWMRIRKGEVDIVIGARSAVFAPFRDIGLILVDEEHEGTYKSDKSPKYDAIEVAVKRAQASGAVVLLGSATPSIVSAYRAAQGLYQTVALTKRYNTTPLPSLQVVDMRKELLHGNKSIFSEGLYAAMIDTLNAGKQVLLFLNRRGWSSFVSCPQCGYVMKCARCSISLTYHKAENRAVCHFCGAGAGIPAACPSCGAEALRFFGLGTEQVESLTQEAFPDRRVARMDVDSTRAKGSAKKILKDFAAGRTDILIGTQMIAKGLDFERVALVGVISADITLNIPDFKSPERTFQLITQVAGRAGRREERGSVYVQTCVPENYAIEAARAHDYDGFYSSELFFRQTLGYPPFSDVIQITVYAPTEEESAAGADAVRAAILSALGREEIGRLLGPRPAPVVRIDSDFRYHLYIKAPTERRRVYEAALAELKRKINTNNSSACRIMIDVNPFSLM